ncbi:MAG: (2Fe-2S)-binding protein [Candidatus Hodarchaeales archaeon]|jgi:carbon-monoxide dehydrogenase small subunit
MITTDQNTNETLEFNLNGKKISVAIPQNITLLDLLRNYQNIKSIKAACWVGDCGICTVLINDIPVKSCLVLAHEISDMDVCTIEGLSDDSIMKRLQDSFIKNGAIQCGYCTGAFLLFGYYLISQQQRFTKDEIKEMLNGIICRCTGYQQIIDSIHQENEAQFDQYE